MDFNLLLRDSMIDEPGIWKSPEKMLALSDIESEFENFRALLIAGRVMDSLYHWTFGRGISSYADLYVRTPSLGGG